MATTTDTQWTERLSAVMPANFMTNTKSSYEAAAGFLENMIDRIGRTVIMGQKNINDPFSDWTSPVLDYGNAIQKYCVPFIEGRKPDYDPAEPNPYKTAKVNPNAQYVVYNDDVQYKTTIFNDRLKMAFTNQAEFGSFTAEITNAMYNSAGLDRFLKWKKYLSKTDYINTTKAKFNVQYNAGNKDEYGYALWMQIKDLVTDKLKYPTKDYNASGMMSASPAFDVVITTEAKNMIDASLKGIYNLEKVSIPNITIKEIDSFATVQGETNPLDVVILSKGMAHYTPKSPESGALYNPENYYTNMWYKEAGYFHFDPFYNAAQIYRSVA